MGANIASMIYLYFHSLTIIYFELDFLLQHVSILEVESDLARADVYFAQNMKNNLFYYINYSVIWKFWLLAESYFTRDKNIDINARKIIRYFYAS